MKHVTGRHIVETVQTLQHVNSRKANKVMQLYFQDCYNNIVNGYGAQMPHSLSIIAELSPNGKNIQKSKQAFFEDGKVVEAYNPHFPNHTLKIKLSGIKAERFGFRFNAHKKLRTECSQKCFGGFKYSMV
tara:strand:+ start:4822 stop:5211 length:390 start_codon:yes stop_codon:yes gene_type:complete